LKLLPHIRVQINGHADHVGSQRAQLLISNRRATSARAHLIRAGIPQERIDTVGSGYTQPLDSSESPEARLRNRRVELKFMSEARK
jgi:outer membrane protein OmpA-like peptidoglycan-associated protein